MIFRSASRTVPVRRTIAIGNLAARSPSPYDMKGIAPPFKLSASRGLPSKALTHQGQRQPPLQATTATAATAAAVSSLPQVPAPSVAQHGPSRRSMCLLSGLAASSSMALPLIYPLLASASASASASATVTSVASSSAALASLPLSSLSAERRAALGRLKGPALTTPEIYARHAWA